MSFFELCPVLVETIGDKDWNIIQPVVARCSRKQDPGILASNVEERLDPGAGADQALFVKVVSVAGSLSLGAWFSTADR